MASLMDWLKGFLASLTSTELSDSLNTIGVKGYEAGRKAGFEDTSENTQGEEPDEEPSKTDTDAINSIGVRTHALSEKTISEAKGSLAVEVDKLYKEMDAAMKAGMSEKEALISIQARMKGLFNECFPEWKIERLVRDQFIVATKEGRRSAWQDSGVKYRQWIMHLDSHTGEDSKRMNGQIAKIDEPYIDPLTGDKYMIPQIRPNDRCLFSSQTPIFTSKGWKGIGKIEIGERVLTHLGRFRKVIGTFRNPRKDGIYKIRVDWNNGEWYETLSMTRDHPLLINDQWVLAKDLEVGMKVKVLSDRCKNCGKLIPYPREFCSRSCISSNIANKQWESEEHRINISKKTKEFMDNWNKQYPEKRKEAVKASHRVLKEKAKLGLHPFQRPENRRKAASTLGNKNPSGLEVIMRDELSRRGIDFEKQYPIDKYFADFAIPKHKIDIECDGIYWHKRKVEKDLARDKTLKKMGWTTLRYDTKQIKSNISSCVDEVERVLMNHTHEYEFVECEISSIEVIEQKIAKMTYNIEVEEDHSFIAKGIINHNCYEKPLYELPEETTEKDGILYAKYTISDLLKYSLDDPYFYKGGVGSGIKGHTTPKKLTPKERKIVTAYQEGVKKLVGDFQSQKKTGKKAVDELRKEFKEKYTQHQQASIKAFTEEHQKTREAAKGRKQARAQKKESPVETKESSKQSDEEQKAKRKARREARKKRQEENLKKEREEAERKAKEEDEKKKKAQEKPEKKEKPKKETKKEKELREWKEERAKELERRREVRSKIFEDDVSKAHNSIMKDPKVTDFLKKTEGMSIEEAVKHLDSSQFLGVHLKDWQEGRYNTMDFMATKVFGLDEGNLRNETQDDMKYYRSSHEQIVGIAGTSLKQYYALTQRFLKEKYPSGYISVYRGVNGNTYNTFQEQGIKEGDDVKLASFNLNSWSLNKDIAQRFANKTKAGIVVETKIPIERVLMHHEILEKHAANPSYGDEKEILILGGGVNAKLSNYGTNPTAPDKEEDFY